MKNYKQKNRSTFSYDIIKINQDSQELLKIDTKNKFIEDLKCFIYSNAIYLTGHFSEYTKKNDKKGFYFSKLNVSNLKQEFNKTIPFEKEYITKMNLNNSKKTFNQTNHLEVIDFFIDDDTYYLINESNYLYSLSQNQTNSNFAVNTWYYGNMSVNKFDNDGNLTNYDIIYKSIPSNNFYPIKSPIASIKKNNYLYLYLWSSKEEKDDISVYKFNDSPKKIYEFKYNLDLDRKTYEYTNSAINTINFFNFENDYLILFTREREKNELIKIIPN